MSYILLRTNRETVLAQGWRIPHAEVSAVSSAVGLLAHAHSRATEVDTLYAEARAQAEAAGFAAGRAAGEAAARAEAAPRLATLLEEVRRSRSAATAQTVELALEIVRRAAGESGWAALVPDVAARTLEELSSEHPLAVRVHPAAFDAVAERLASIDPGLRVTADEAAAPGACVFELTGGRVDAGAEVQLEAIERALLGEAAL